MTEQSMTTCGPDIDQVSIENQIDELQFGEPEIEQVSIETDNSEGDFADLPANEDYNPLIETALRVPLPDNAMPREQFKAMFKQVVILPNVYRHRLKKQRPFESLQFLSEQPETLEAADAVYEICAEIPWLNFLIGPESVWGKRIMAIGGLGFGMWAMTEDEKAMWEEEAKAKQGASNDQNQTG